VRRPGPDSVDPMRGEGGPVAEPVSSKSQASYIEKLSEARNA
jgi:hypothetical protein